MNEELEKSVESVTPEKENKKTWEWFLYSALILGLAGYLWWFFTDFEQQGGSRRMHWLVAFLYNLLGKIPTVGIFGALGVLMLGMGIHELCSRKKQVTD